MLESLLRCFVIYMNLYFVWISLVKKFWSKFQTFPLSSFFLNFFMHTNYSFELCRILYLEIRIAQMNFLYFSFFRRHFVLIASSFFFWSYQMEMLTYVANLKYFMITQHPPFVKVTPRLQLQINNSILVSIPNIYLWKETVKNNHKMKPYLVSIDLHNIMRT